MAAPRLSIVTTVYDRVECLRQCIASVRRLAFRDHEHLIVADHPPPDVLARIRELVVQADDPRIGLHDLRWCHVDRASFIFRLAKYPGLMQPRPPA